VSLDVQKNKVDLPINQTSLIQNDSNKIFSFFCIIPFHILTKKNPIRDLGNLKQLKKSNTKPRKKEELKKNPNSHRSMIVSSATRGYPQDVEMQLADVRMLHNKKLQMSR
jgi:hypothetical protein